MSLISYIKDLFFPRSYYGKIIYKDKDHENDFASIDEMRLKAIKGDCEAMFQYGCFLQDIDKYEEAWEYFNKAATLCHPAAYYKIGVFYQYGFYVEKNYEKAWDWYHKSMKLKYAQAFVNMGYLYDKGLYPVQDYQMARHYYQKASDLGNGMGSWNLALMYKNGEGVDRNITSYHNLTKLAIEQGYERICESYADQFRYGEGTQENPEEAFKWYQVATKHYSKTAFYALGECYETGYGTEKNLQAASEFYAKADLKGENELFSQGRCLFNLAKEEQSLATMKKAMTILKQAEEKGSQDASCFIVEHANDTQISSFA